MRWLIIILFFAVAVAAGTAPLWWNPLQPYLGPPPHSLASLATWISAVAALLGVIATVIGHLAKGEGSAEPTRQIVQGSVVKGNVSAQGDFVGRNKITIGQGESKKQP